MRVELTPAETEESVKVQIKLLLEAAERFDRGDLDEALNLAIRLRVLLHHNPKRNSHAGLAQLGLLDMLGFADTAGDLILENPVPDSRLTYMTVDFENHPRHIPRFNDFAEPLLIRTPLQWQISRRVRGLSDPRPGGRGRDFQDWWSQRIIRVSDQQMFTRQGLVTSVANQDGGGHIDPKIRAEFHALTRGNSLGWSGDIGHGTKALQSPVPASIRQISWELHLTLVEQADHLLPADPRFRTPPDSFETDRTAAN